MNKRQKKKLKKRTVVVFDLYGHWSYIVSWRVAREKKRQLKREGWLNGRCSVLSCEQTDKELPFVEVK